MLVAAGLVAAARWTPAAPPAWRVVERFGFDAAACDARLALRESVPFVVPPRREGPPSPAELAGWFRLDADALCAANGVAPASCAGHVFEAGQVAVLPLGRAAAGADGAAAAAPGDAPAARRL